jgi:FAD/FMN-containing dehydrogenase
MRLIKFVGRLVIIFVLLIIMLATYVLLDFDKDIALNQIKPNIVNDITKLNPIKVTRVVKPDSIDDIVKAIRSSSGPISIGGGRFSQGGQTSFPDSVHLDMRSFKKVLSLNINKRQVTVQSGITWRDLQEVIDREDLSVKIMQTYSNFTIGGSLSVNVHGRYVGEGPIIRSVDSMKVILANGDIVNVSPLENPTIFNGVIGGYGGIAVIVEVTLNLEKNVKVKRHTKTMKLQDYSEYFTSNIRNNTDVIFHNADIYPPEYTDVRSVSWQKTDEKLTVKRRLIPQGKEYDWQPKVAEFVADSNFGKWMRQYVMEPLLYSFDAVQWRNYEASYDVYELEPKNRVHTTYALREYFLPIKNFDSFAGKMSAIFKKYEVNIINVSIRHALPDSGSILSWARTEVFAFVVYYRQGTSEKAQQEVKLWSQEIIEVLITENGTYYLPYQLHATTEQFMKAYPGANDFFDLKQQVDPNNRFRNKLWEQHYQ